MDIIDNKKKIYLGIIAILAIAFIVTLVSLLRTRSELAKLSTVDASLGQYQDSLSVCEHPDNLDDQNLCTRRLTDLSNSLAKYAERLQSLKPAN